MDSRATDQVDVTKAAYNVMRLSTVSASGYQPESARKSPIDDAIAKVDALAAAWDESKHSRDAGGKFAPKFGDDDEGKSKGDLVRFGKKTFVAMIFIIAAPTIIAPLMGVDINTFCAVGEDEQCQENAIFSEDVTGLISIAFNAIRIGGAVVIIVAFGIKGIQYRLVPRP